LKVAKEVGSPRSWIWFWFA